MHRLHTNYKVSDAQLLRMIQLNMKGTQNLTAGNADYCQAIYGPDDVVFVCIHNYPP